MKKRKLLAIMMASLALAGVGFETVASLNSSESIVEAKSRKTHHKHKKHRMSHKRNNNKRRNSKKKKAIKKKQTEYLKGNIYYNHGVSMTIPKRYELGGWDINTGRNNDIEAAEWFDGFWISMKNNSKHTIKPSEFITKHLILKDKNGNVIPITNSTVYTYHELRLDDNCMIYSGKDYRAAKEVDMEWSAARNNFNKNLYKKHSANIACGFVYQCNGDDPVSPEKHFEQSTYTMTLLNDKGQELKTWTYVDHQGPHVTFLP